MSNKAGPAIDRSIYQMPMFVSVIVRDLAKAQELYFAAGFVTLATIPGPGGDPALVHLRREKYQDILLIPAAPPTGEVASSTLPTPSPTISTSFAAGDVDLAETARLLRAAGAEVSGPEDTIWFSTDVSFTDADGNRVTLTAPRPTDQVEAREWTSTHIEGDFERPLSQN